MNAPTDCKEPVSEYDQKHGTYQPMKKGTPSEAPAPKTVEPLKLTGGK